MNDSINELYAQRNELKGKLADCDYLSLKAAEGCSMSE